MRQRKAFTREERRLMIYQAFATELSKGGSGEMTTAEIAHYLHVAPSTKLRIILNEMVLDGDLVSRRQKHPGIAGYRIIYETHAGFHLDRLYKAQKQAKQRPAHGIRINSAQGSFWSEI